MSKKIIIGIFVLLIFSAIAGAAELSDYPDFFIDDNSLDVIIVVGDKAPASHVLAQADILLSLGQLVSDARGKTKLASEVEDLGQNIISIGNACINNVSAGILGNPERCKAENAEILLFEEDGNVHMVLNANSEDAVRSLAEKLVNYDSAELGNTVEDIDIPEIDESGKEDEDDEQDIEETGIEAAEDLDVKSTDKGDIAIEKIIEEENMPEDKQNTEVQPILKKDNPIKKLISWFLSLFSQK